MQIKAAVARAPDRPFVIEPCELRDPGPGEVLVRISACGICHTDLGAKHQHVPVPLPAVLGHEGAGIVERVGAGIDQVEVGDAVLMSFGSCGTCPQCQDGHPSYCSHFLPVNFFNARGAAPAISCDGVALNGDFFTQSAFATHAIATVRNVVKVDKTLPLDLLAPLGCGIQTGVGAVVNVLKPRAGSSLAVFGVGSVGLAALIGAKIVGCTTIIAVDVKPSRLVVARQLGATHVLQGAEVDVVAEIQRITGGGVDYAVDTSGNGSVVKQAFNSLGFRGTLGTVAAPPMGTEYAFDAHALLAGRSVVGVIEGDSLPSEFIPRLVEFYRHGLLPLEQMVTRYPFERINEAVSDTESGKVVKAVLVME